MSQQPASPTAPSPVRVLLLEDDAEAVREIRATLENSALGEFQVVQVAQVEEAIARLQEGGHDVMLLELSLPDDEGLDALAHARVAAQNVPIVAMIREADEMQSLRALHLGARDCLVKGKLEPRLVVRSLLHAVECQRLASDLESARHREHYTANHDPLTGLPNRYAFLSYLRRSLAWAGRHRQRLAVLFLDMDRFQVINDTSGHTAADELLTEVSRRLRKIVRKSDMVARVGGDEFIVLLKDVDRDCAPAKVAEQMLESVARPFELEGRECWLTASVGIAIFPSNGSDADTLTQSADTAMYQAKVAGKNCYRFFDDSMTRTAQRHLQVESRLRRALERNELALHYQPQLDLATGRICGAEALLRWSDQELGEVSPAELVAVAEQTNLIVRIGAWVLEQACQRAAAWRQAGFPDLRVAVNVSTLQLERNALRETLVQALWRSGLDAQGLEIEITENALIRNLDEKVEVLAELKALGVALALDDFGTGFSSLAYLKRIPVDRLKIDYSFVRDMVIDSDDAAIVGAIISIAEKFGLRVIAEGVETPQQLELLRALGCHEIQGFGLSRPLPPDELLAMLRKRLGNGADGTLPR